MKVLVTGATGLIGGAAAAELRRRRHAVVALCRSEEACNAVGKAGFGVRHGDLADPASLAAAAADVDAVVHCAFAMNPADMSRGAQLDSSAVSTWLDALSGSGRSFVYTSGSLVLGDTGEQLRDELDPPSDPPPFVAWRAEIEQRVRTAEGVRGIIVRPALVYGGRGNAMLTWLRDDAVRRGAAMAIDGGRNAWSSIHTDDLATLYALALEGGETGATYHGAAGPPCLLADIARAIADSAGLDGRIADVSLADAAAALPFAAAIAMNSRIDSRRTQNALGWRPSARSVLDDLREVRR